MNSQSMSSVVATNNVKDHIRARGTEAEHYRVPTTQKANRFRFLLLAIALLVGWAYPYQLRAQNLTIATNNRSEWLSTGNGWSTDRQWHGVAPPAGNYNFNYKQWFEPPATGEPGAWTTFKTYAKPPAASWDGTEFGTDTFTTRSGASYDESDWYAKLYTSFTYFGAIKPEYYSKLQTKSVANAARGTGINIAGSKTEITDPVTLSNPGSGNWSVRDDFALFGDVLAPNDKSFIQYDVGLSLSSGGTPTNVLSLVVGGKDATLTVNNSFLNSFGGHLVFADSSGEIESQATLEAKLNSYYTSDGWQLDPSSFDISSFEPDNQSELDQIFATQIFIQIPGSYSTVTVYTDSISEALAPAPEPTSLFLFGSGILGLSGLLRRRLLMRG